MECLSQFLIFLNFNFIETTAYFLLQGLLRFYGLPGAKTDVPGGGAPHQPPTAFVAGGTWPQGVQYEIHTLPVCIYRMSTRPCLCILYSSYL